MQEESVGPIDCAKNVAGAEGVSLMAAKDFTRKDIDVVDLCSAPH